MSILKHCKEFIAKNIASARVWNFLLAFPGWVFSSSTTCDNIYRNNWLMLEELEYFFQTTWIK